jgi:hypothetical protein
MSRNQYYDCILLLEYDLTLPNYNTNSTKPVEPEFCATGKYKQILSSA